MLAGLGDTSGPAAQPEPAHLAAMHLSALAGLPRLSSLEVLYGIVRLAEVPAAVASLALVDTDRLLLRPGAGGGGRTVVDLLLAQLQRQGESAGAVLAAAAKGLHALAAVRRLGWGMERETGAGSQLCRG